MSGASPYDDLIMDHIRNARNYRALERASACAQGSNPLCGDEINVYLELAGDCVGDVAFQCTCCGISMASASIMTDAVKGKSVDEARVLLRAFIALIDSRSENPPDDTRAEWRAMLDTVRRFSTRAGCAVLPWTTLEAALQCAPPANAPV
jgi:nitrogen fixation NifU-like protein